MTAIAAVTHKGRVYVGGDSAGVSGWDLTVRADSKVFTTGPFVMGFTSSFRMGQLLRYALKPPPLPDEEPRIAAYMVTTFVDAVRACLKEGGWAKKDNEQEQGGVFLVGVRGRLFTVHSDYQIAESADGYAAVGAGDSQALGALFATPDLKPRQRLRLALAAAERFSASVRGPFHIEAEPT